MVKKVVLTLLGIIVVAVVIFYAGRCALQNDGSVSYMDIKMSMGVAVTAYALQAHSVTPPTTGETVTIDKGTFDIIDICKIVDTVSFDQEVLDALLLACADTTHDNCELGPCSCNTNAHYVWLVSDALNAFSTCVGSDCADNNEDGYQGVWP
jgi:hypothetical protein